MLNWLWRAPLILFIMVLLHYQNEHIKALEKQLEETREAQVDLGQYQADCMETIAKLSSKYRGKK
jgi:hypothetical protein